MYKALSRKAVNDGFSTHGTYGQFFFNCVHVAFLVASSNLVRVKILVKTDN